MDAVAGAVRASGLAGPLDRSRTDDRQKT